MAQNGCQRAATILTLNLHLMSAPHQFWRVFYDRVAFAYDAVLRAGAWLHLGSEEHIRREVIGNLGLPAKARALEIGCGTASNRAHLPANVYFVGLDISRGMLTRARTKCAKLRLAADFVQADATSLPFSAGWADLALAMGVLQHVANPSEAISGMERVVHTGGRMLIIDERRSQERILQKAKHDNVPRNSTSEYFILHIIK